VTHTFRARLDALLEQDNDLQKKHDRAVDDANRVAGDVAKTLSMNLSSDRAALSSTGSSSARAQAVCARTWSHRL